MVYAKPPFGRPQAVLAYHRVAISNARLVSADAHTVAFRWKDYRIKSGDRQKVMRLATPEFIHRFLIHVLPHGFHRIRHYGLLASSTRKANITRVRALLCVQPERVAVPEPQTEIAPLTLREPCPCCGGTMRIIEIFRGSKPHDISLVIRHGTPPAAIRRPGPNTVCPFNFSADGNNSETHRPVEIIGRVCDRIRHLPRH